MPAEHDLIHLAYVSTQTEPMSSMELINLLTSARKTNTERDITGLLLHKNECFFQIIEGPTEQVRLTFETICRDPRHHGIEVLLEEKIEDREYADWRMGFVNLDTVDPSLLKGYSEFLENNENPRAFLAALSRGEQLALLFRSLH